MTKLCRILDTIWNISKYSSSIYTTLRIPVGGDTVEALPWIRSFRQLEMIYTTSRWILNMSKLCRLTMPIDS